MLTFGLQLGHRTVHITAHDKIEMGNVLNITFFHFLISLEIRATYKKEPRPQWPRRLDTGTMTLFSWKPPPIYICIVTRKLRAVIYIMLL